VSDLDQLGFDPVVSDGDRGDTVVAFANCPFGDLAREHPDLVCSLHHGMVAGFVFGFAFGIGAIGAAVLGALADQIGIVAVFGLCAFLPFLGFLTIFLPRHAELHGKVATA